MQHVAFKSNFPRRWNILLGIRQQSADAEYAIGSISLSMTCCILSHISDSVCCPLDLSVMPAHLRVTWLCMDPLVPTATEHKQANQAWAQAYGITSTPTWLSQNSMGTRAGGKINVMPSDSQCHWNYNPVAWMRVNAWDLHKTSGLS